MFKKISINKFFQINILLLPIFLLTGPFFPDLVITLISITFIIFYSKELILILKNEKVILFFFIFWIFLVISSLLSDYILYSLKSSLFYIRFIVFSAAFYYLLTIDTDLLEKLFTVLKVAIYIMCLASLFEFFFEKNLYLIDKPTLRLTGTFKDEQIVGSFLTKIFPIFMSLFFFLEKKINLEFFLICLVTFSIVILSNERTAIFFIILFFIFLIFIYPNLSLKKKMVGFSLIILTFLTIIFSVEDVRKRTVDLTLSQMGIFYFNSQNKPEFSGYKEADRFHLFSKSHEIHILTAYNIFKSNLIVGVGPKNFRKECDNEKYFISQASCTTHPHNILFQLLAENGIIGFSFLFVSVIFLIKNFYMIFKKKDLSNQKYILSKLCLLFILSQNIFFLLPSGNYLNNFLSAQMFLPLGLYIYIDKRIKNDNVNYNINN